MKILKVLGESMADVPPVLIKQYDNLLRQFKQMAPTLNPATVEDIQELFQNLDDDFHTGDVGFIEETLDDIQSLLS